MPKKAKQKNEISIPEDVVYIVELERFFRMRDSAKLNHEQFAITYLLNTNARSKEMLTNGSVAIYDKISFNPLKERTYIENDLRIYNVYKGVPYIKEDNTTPTLFLEHIQYICGVNAHIMLDFLAFQIQHIGNKMRWSLLLQGSFGIGKGYISNIMSKLMGDNFAVINDNMIKEQFNSWIINKTFGVVDEIMTEHRQRVMNQLKTFITEDTVVIRKMRKDTFEYPNRMNFLFLTNYDDAIKIPEKERRYCVIFSNAVQKDEDYYKRLFDWSYQNLGSISHYLKNRDLSAFCPYGNAPHTIDRDILVRTSMSTESKTLQDFFNENNFQFSYINITDLQNWLKNNNVYITKLQEALKAIGYKESNVVRIHTATRRFWTRIAKGQNSNASSIIISEYGQDICKEKDNWVIKFYKKNKE